MSLLNVLLSGNAQTLKHEPRDKQINTYEQLRLFWRRYYSAHYMTLAVQSKGTRPPPQDVCFISQNEELRVYFVNCFLV